MNPYSRLNLLSRRQRGSSEVSRVETSRVVAEEVGIERHGLDNLKPCPSADLKLDSARGIDQGDLTRMLGRLNDREVEQIIDEVERYSEDPAFAGKNPEYGHQDYFSNKLYPHEFVRHGGRRCRTRDCGQPVEFFVETGQGDRHRPVDEVYRPATTEPVIPDFFQIELVV